ncbi:endonuclease domain-containing protein [Salinimicrobium sp. GXAS 041]|uniref:endonuclease domain-containing protein n=1 Tax=Salinimicrobium sp. GXAS 041 TaxID=3400806 RepID=UPI003C713CB6
MKKKNPYYDESMWKGAPSDHFGRAKRLRGNMTEAEILLWEKLIVGEFRQFKFRRQHPIQQFIVDFYSHRLQLIIEVDGGYHEFAERQQKDEERSELLKFQGLEIIRFGNDEILSNLRDVLQILKKKIHKIDSTAFPDSL